MYLLNNYIVCDDLNKVINKDNIYSINCNNCELHNLNVSEFKNLVELYCSDNHLSELDLSNNKYLKVLHCDNNNINKDKLIVDFNKLIKFKIDKKTCNNDIIYYYGNNSDIIEYSEKLFY